MQFEWDENKNRNNQRKHGISFEEAQTVFDDVEGLLIDDPQHSADEDRFVITGMSGRANILVVCHCYRKADRVVRIFSARKATRAEERQYQQSLP